jgi:predicted regulator of Ras-like GTPase activity (Roadblock/LC7/MglB family)
MKDMILFPEDIDRLNLILSQLVVKADLLLSVLINKDGRLLTSQGSLDQVDTVSMAALVAGNSASTLAIAQLMGEHEFSTMYHQGKNKHIYIAVVDDNTFLALVFDDRTNIDRVKVFVRQFDRQLKAGLVLVYDKTEDQVNLDLDLGSMLDQAMQQQHSQQPAQPPKNFYQPQEFFDSVKPSQTKVQQAPQTKVHQQQQMPLHTQPGDEPVFDVDSPRNTSTPNDTNYIYLQNKIKETMKRKKEE